MINLPLLPEPGLSDTAIAERVENVLATATLAEKVAMMSGQGFFKQYKADGKVWGASPYRAGGGVARLGVPAFFFSDGPRGVARGQSTCFPCTMARGATFDTDLERRIGEAMAIELRAQGCNLSGAVCINLLRHPAWGRAQETYGEDPQHLGAMGAALAIGLQAHNVCATVKHFALNSMENMRFTVDVSIDERALHEVYLPHFKTVLDAGCRSVMSAYNKLNGEYCGENRTLLTDILRHEWGFTGFVHSDWIMGVHTVWGAAAGLDVENPEPRVWGEKLLAAVEAGTLAASVVDTACRRILTTLYSLSSAEDPLPDYPESLVASPAHAALALEAAEKSAVLLKNDSVLPFAPGTRLAVLGRLAGIANTGDNGSSRVRARHVVTALEGLSAVSQVVTGDEADLAAATAAAQSADAVVVIAGYTAQEEGEYIPGGITLGQEGGGKDIGGDRSDLGLPADQIALIKAAASAGKPLVVVIVAGSAVLVEPWHEQAGAILQSFYSGQAGGTALARLLFGQVSPSGRLPFTVARDPAHYPRFDRTAAAITYDLWHGYALFDSAGTAPRYGFGHGLSYTRFGLRALALRQSGSALLISVAVSNDGAMAAETPVLAFVTSPPGPVERWPRKLAAFTRVALQPGETRIVMMTVRLADLRWRGAGRWHFQPGDHGISVTTGDALLARTIRIDSD
ncbi:glycoside hydrolase family 3 C-terminal domain-containing protein [Sandarakinorhabdus sp. AAP62]|uniref:beta-glucosidase family protein n=1 Tax=Sandarakinorhabdus sp. AAP62 TaxID=1248916 RepID=UPI00031C3A56|nr:glycoside hydrolase family 3 C-terminal domain-containing protein [Sandarakinorhabdus sp. AAP62]